MSHPLSRLQALFRTNTSPIRGEVVSVSGVLAKVRTPTGIRQCTVNGLAVSPGTEVSVNGNSLVSVAVPLASTPAYDV